MTCFKLESSMIMKVLIFTLVSSILWWIWVYIHREIVKYSKRILTVYQNGQFYVKYRLHHVEVISLSLYILGKSGLWQAKGVIMCFVEIVYGKPKRSLCVLNFQMVLLTLWAYWPSYIISDWLTPHEMCIC